MAVKHAFVSGKADGGDATLVRPSDWNASHSIDDATIAPAKLTAGIVQTGKSIVATSEVRTNTAYGTLTTPDQVTGLVLPTDGLIAVLFHATWQASVGGAGRAAIFVGANQLKTMRDGDTAPVTEAAVSVGAAKDNLLGTAPIGLYTATTMTSGTGWTGDVTTGQTLGGVFTSGLTVADVEFSGATAQLASIGSPQPHGGLCYIFAAAGTYTVSVQFKSSSGSVTASNRKLWCWVVGF